MPLTALPFRPVLIVCSVAALALSLGACGRKSALDSPSYGQAQPAPAAAATAEAPIITTPGAVIDQTFRDNDLPPAERSKRKFILDPLLGSD